MKTTKRFKLAFIVLLMALVLVGWWRWFSGPRFKDVNTFLHQLKHTNNWVMEWGPGLDQPGYIQIDWMDEVRYIAKGNVTLFVFHTPHYMVFADVTHINGRVKKVIFHGPIASKAVSEIDQAFKDRFPRIQYSIEDYPESQSEQAAPRNH